MKYLYSNAENIIFIFKGGGLGRRKRFTTLNDTEEDFEVMN